MPFDLLDDRFDRQRRGRRPGVGGLLDRILGGDRDHRRDDDRDDDRNHERRRKRGRDTDSFDFD